MLPGNQDARPYCLTGECSLDLERGLIDFARKKGVLAYLGDGLSRWPAVHRLDAAHLYRLVLAKGSAGAQYHGSPMRACRSVTSLA